MLLDEVRNLEQIVGTLMRADGGPFAVERLAGRLDRFINVGLVALGHEREDFLVGWVDGFEGLAGLGRDPLAADQ